MLTREEILSIPERRKQGATAKQIASELGVHTQTIIRWVKELRLLGRDVGEVKKGRKKMQL